MWEQVRLLFKQGISQCFVVVNSMFPTYAVDRAYLLTREIPSCSGHTSHYHSLLRHIFALQSVLMFWFTEHLCFDRLKVLLTRLVSLIRPVFVVVGFLSVGCSVIPDFTPHTAFIKTPKRSVGVLLHAAVTGFMVCGIIYLNIKVVNVSR